MSDVDTATEETNDAIGAKYKERYGKDKHCGDDIAVLLKAFCANDKGKVDPDKLAKVFKANKIDGEKYKHLNIGMQRMTLGNVLRGLVNKGTDVKIGSDVVEGVADEEAA